MAEGAVTSFDVTDYRVDLGGTVTPTSIYKFARNANLSLAGQAEGARSWSRWSVLEELLA